MDRHEREAHRRQKDQFFKTSSDSPLTPAQKAAFDGLAYYPPDAQLAFEVQVEPFAAPATIMMDTNTGALREYQRFGQFTITVDGEAVRLTIYEAPYGFFLPFVDAGAGVETYPAGRYLEPEHLGDNLFRVDFNDAYNPYCAYNDNWTCPLTPPENRVTVHIRAGEKLPEGAWVTLAE